MSVLNADTTDSEIELELCNFYINIIKDMYKMYNLPVGIVRSSLNNIMYYNTALLKETADRLAYILAFSFIHTILMYYGFSHTLKYNSAMSKELASKTKLRLCLLGGAPGFEAVAICKILNILRRQNASECQALTLNITIVDSCKYWEKDAEFIISSAQKEIGSSNDIHIEFDFIAANLTGDLPENVTKALKEADIVTMFKFLSDVNDSPCYSEREIYHMIRNIIDHLKFGACLFFLDTAGCDAIKKMNKMTINNPRISRIYQTEFGRQELSLDSVELISESLKSILGHLKCVTRTTISCAAWLKVQHTFRPDRIVSGISAMSLK